MSDTWNTWSEYLQLPPGYVATEFVSTIEIECPDGRRVGFGKPYDPMTREEWIAAAKQAIESP